MDAHVYQICVQGHLDARWLSRFAGMQITLTPAGETIFTGPLVDQAALYGVLNQIHDLGLTLISVQRQPQEKE